MKKSDYRKFIIQRRRHGRKDRRNPKACCATISRACAKSVERRYRRLREEDKPLPSLILIDGGIGQLHAAAQALEKLEIINQPIASIAKKEEILYVLGREDEPCRPRPSFSRSAPDPADSRRDAPLRRHISSPAPIEPPHCALPLSKFPEWASAPRKNCCVVSAASRACSRLTLEELTAELPRGQAQRIFDALRQ